MLRDLGERSLSFHCSYLDRLGYAPNPPVHLNEFGLFESHPRNSRSSRDTLPTRSVPPTCCSHSICASNFRPQKRHMACNTQNAAALLPVQWNEDRKST